MLECMIYCGKPQLVRGGNLKGASAGVELPNVGEYADYDDRSGLDIGFCRQ